MDFDNFNCIHGRAEELAQAPALTFGKFLFGVINLEFFTLTHQKTWFIVYPVSVDKNQDIGAVRF